MSRKRMDVAEFRSQGYLQELNRRFLHPLGLAIEVVVDDDGHETLSGVWDSRDDVEGIRFEASDDRELSDMIVRARNVDALWAEREWARIDALGYMVQMLE